MPAFIHTPAHHLIHYLCYTFLKCLVFSDDLPVLELLFFLLLLVIFFLAGVVGVLPDEDDLGYHDQGHRKEAAEQVGQRHERERSILLVAWKIKLVSMMEGEDVLSISKRIAPAGAF